jgi:hypothetical protein
MIDTMAGRTRPSIAAKRLAKKQVRADAGIEIELADDDTLIL